MFDLKAFLDAPCVDDSFVVRRGDEEFRLRRLDGAERLRFDELTTRLDRVKFALARCLLDPETREPVGEKTAEKLIARAGSLAEALFADIYDATRETVRAERELWREVKKKTSRRGWDDCEGLARRYRARYALPPERVVSRREALIDEFYAILSPKTSSRFVDSREEEDDRIRRDFAPTLARAKAIARRG